ncbi:hypothetical protein [Archangium violaceum]|uniref:hypothetical protein n=1 Tax=Archangium violaceum TaxID=83451 RepID=UPI0036D8E50F
MTAPTEGEPTPAPAWLPVPDAAAAAGVPVRSLYRWIEKKRVPTRQERGTTVVDVAAVRAYAARRAALKESGARAGIADTSADTAPTMGLVRGADAGSDRARGIERTGVSGTSPTVTKPALTTSGNATPTTSDAELAAEVFGRFEEGDTPVDVVREMRIPPERVRALHREWTELRAMGGGGGPTITERLAELESRLKELTETMSFEVMSVEVNANNAIGRLESRLEILERRLAGTSVPPPGFNFGPRR